MYKRINPETKTFKLFEALINGEKLTPAQIKKRFSIKNVSAEVSRVRQGGLKPPLPPMTRSDAWLQRGWETLGFTLE